MASVLRNKLGIMSLSREMVRATIGGVVIVAAGYGIMKGGSALIMLGRLPVHGLSFRTTNADRFALHVSHDTDGQAVLRQSIAGFEATSRHATITGQSSQGVC